MFHTRALYQETVSWTLNSDTNQSAAFNLDVELHTTHFNSVIGLLKTKFRSSTASFLPSGLNQSHNPHWWILKTASPACVTESKASSAGRMYEHFFSLVLQNKATNNLKNLKTETSEWIKMLWDRIH